MNQPNDLEGFRKEWKKELSSKSKPNNTNAASDETNACPRPGISKSNIKDSLACEQPKQDSSSNFQQNEKWYYPFGIVGKLLNKSKCENTNDESGVKEKCDTDSVKSNALKRRNDQQRSENFSHFKKKKRLEDVFSERNIKREFTQERILDRFIADLDEITEIPFFDISLPREVAVNIFKHLEMKDLCRCAQVSKSWSSLAEDELLWCNICHELGFEMKHLAVEKMEWKNVVKDNIMQQRQLISNWKNRTGALTSLQHVQGGLLCSVNSCEDKVVAGYTNGEVKMWNLDQEEDCVLQPSSSALVIDETVEEGTISNYVETVIAAGTLVAAAYRQGNIDVWRVCEGSDISPIHTVSYNSPYKQVCLCLAKHSETMVTAGGPVVYVHSFKTADEFHQSSRLDLNKWVEHSKILERKNLTPRVVIATSNDVYLHMPGGSVEELVEIHSCYQGIGVIDIRTDPDQVVCGSSDTVYVHDISTRKLIGILHGHTALITCVNLTDSPPQQLVTGSIDRKVRVFDMRTDMPVMTYSGHPSSLTTVQMDDWKVVSGDEAGFVRVWDQRMGTKLWEWHNRHPVGYCHFTKERLILGNIPRDKSPAFDKYENIAHKRYRGSVQVYDFTVDQILEGLPDICLSTYDEPEAYNYNIKLAMPYDKLWVS